MSLAQSFLSIHRVGQENLLLKPYYESGGACLRGQFQFPTYANTRAPPRVHPLPPVGGGTFWQWMSCLAVDVDRSLANLMHGRLWGQLFGGACSFLAVDVAFWRWMLLFGGACGFLAVDLNCKLS